MLWRLGIRTQLLLLIGLAAAPLLALLLLGASLQRELLAREAEHQLAKLVEDIALRHATLVHEGQSLAALLAAADVRPGPDGRGCYDFFTRLRDYGRTGWRFSVFNRDGWLVCAGGGQSRINIARQPFFREAQRGGEAVVGYYARGRTGGSPTLPIVQPLRDATGAFDGAVLAALPLRSLREMLQDLDLPPGARLQVVDYAGNLLAERAEAGAPPLAPAEWLGHVDPLAASHVARLDGRLVVVSDAGGSGLSLAVGVSEARAMAAADRRLRIDLALACVALLGVGAVVALFAERAFVRRVRRLAAVAGRLRRGDLTARSGLAERGDEIGELARGIDGMAADLESQHGRLAAREAQYRHLAMHDPLTGVANRRGFMTALQLRVRVAHAPGGRFALLLVDLDDFKLVNDRWGHDAGDALLVAAAGRLRAAVRGRDLVARLAGDEFAVLIECGPDAEPDLAAIAARLVETLAEPYALACGAIDSAATLGLAICPDHARDAPALLKAADVALYEAKLAGRRTWRRFAGDALPMTALAGPSPR